MRRAAARSGRGCNLRHQEKTARSRLLLGSSARVPRRVGSSLAGSVSAPVSVSPANLRCPGSPARTPARSSAGRQRKTAISSARILGMHEQKAKPDFARPNRDAASGGPFAEHGPRLAADIIGCHCARDCRLCGDETNFKAGKNRASSEPIRASTPIIRRANSRSSLARRSSIRRR